MLTVTQPSGPSTRATGLVPGAWVAVTGRGPHRVITPSPTAMSSIGRHDPSAMRTGVPTATHSENSNES